MTELSAIFKNANHILLYNSSHKPRRAKTRDYAII